MRNSLNISELGGFEVILGFFHVRCNSYTHVNRSLYVRNVLIISEKRKGVQGVGVRAIYFYGSATLQNFFC